MVLAFKCGKKVAFVYQQRDCNDINMRSTASNLLLI